MLDPELKKKWVAALRSGDYTQTSGCLKDKIGYCCLGVLANIIDPTKWEKEEGLDRYTHIDYGGELLYSKVLDLDIQYTLTDLNDNGITFDEIATIIENREDI